MKKYIIIAFLLVGYIFPSKGQNLAGYLGRQVTVYGNIKSFVRLRDAAKDKQPPFNAKLSAGIDFVVSKRISLAFEFETFKTGFGTDLPYLNENYGYEYGYNYNYGYGYGYNNDYIDYTTVQLGCNVQTYGVLIHLFSGRKGHLAPYGKYQVMGVKFLSITEKDYRNEIDKYNKTYQMNIRDPQFSTYGYGLTYGVGKKWIYFDRLILDIKFQSCLVLDKNFMPPILLSQDDDVSDSYGSDYNTNPNDIDFTINLEKDMLERVAFHSFFDLSVGLGFLIF